MLLDGSPSSIDILLLDSQLNEKMINNRKNVFGMKYFKGHYCCKKPMVHARHIFGDVWRSEMHVQYYLVEQQYARSACNK